MRQIFEIKKQVLRKRPRSKDLPMRIQGGHKVKLILCVIACEALTELIADAHIFDRPREFLSSKSTFLEALLSCPYCLSVWMAAVMICALWQWEVGGVFVIWLCIHRGSNWLHDVIATVKNFKIDQILERRRHDG